MNMAPQNNDQLARVQAVIHAFARKYNFLHEKRIQKLLFCAEYMSLEKRGKPFPDLRFRRFHYGVYSDEINLALSEAKQLRTEPDTAPDGKATVVFMAKPGIDVEGLSREELAFVDAVDEWTRKMTTEELAAFGKSTTAWRAAKQDEELDLRRMLTQPGFRTNPDQEAELVRIKKQIKSGKVHSYKSDEEFFRSLR